MEYNIKQLSYYAEKKLQHPKSGIVHSVYRRTINLTYGRDILSLQADGSPLSPISLITGLTADAMRALEVKTGDTVCFTGKGLELQGGAHSFRFSYENAVRSDLKLSGPMDARSLSILSSNIRTALSHSKTGGFALLFNEEKDADDLSLILRGAKNYILHCNERSACKRYPEAALELSRLLGLGTGLTPSGDDFLCGVLAGLHFSGNTGHSFTRCLKDIIAAHLSDTIDISAAFLACALEDQFSLPVTSLYRLPAPDALLALFEEIGHSSGTDTLCGILWSLEHI